MPQLQCQINTLRPRQNGRHFADDTLKPIFLNENIQISIKISLKFVPKVPINNIPALVQIMAWHRPGDKPLSEPMMVCLLMHICVTRPQWVNYTPHNTRDVIIQVFHNLTNRRGIVRKSGAFSLATAAWWWPLTLWPSLLARSGTLALQTGRRDRAMSDYQSSRKLW